MSNLGQYINDVRLYIGDIAGATFSDSTILRALENSIGYLTLHWNSKYLIYSSGIVNSTTPGYVTVNVPQGTVTLADTVVEGDVFRNTHVAFTSVAPPIIEQRDLPAVLIAASYLLFRSLAASTTLGLSWSTPDLSFSNIQASKNLQDYIKQQLEALHLFFKQKLGRIQIGGFNRSYEQLQEYPPVEVANYYYRMAQSTRLKD